MCFSHFLGFRDTEYSQNHIYPHMNKLFFNFPAVFSNPPCFIDSVFPELSAVTGRKRALHPKQANVWKNFQALRVRIKIYQGNFTKRNNIYILKIL